MFLISSVSICLFASSGQWSFALYFASAQQHRRATQAHYRNTIEESKKALPAFREKYCRERDKSIEREKRKSERNLVFFRRGGRDRGGCRNRRRCGNGSDRLPWGRQYGW